MNKRQKVEEDGRRVRIWTPFNKCIYFEPNFLHVIDNYTNKSFQSNFAHWFFAYNMNNDVEKALYTASFAGNLKTVQILFSYIQQMDRPYIYNIHILKEAMNCCCQTGHFKIVQYLVSGDTTIIEPRHVATAARWNHFDIVQYLIELSASDENEAITKKYDYCLCMAAEHGQMEFAKYFVRLGADVNHKFADSPVTAAAINGHLKMLQYLVSVGADLKKKNFFAIRGAIANNHLQVVQYFVSQGVDVMKEYLECFRQAIVYNRLDIVKYLISLGADIHTCAEDYLLLAVENGHLNIVKYLISLGADIHTCVEDYFFSAVENGHLPIVKYIYDIESNFELDIFMQKAIEHGHLPIVQYLVSRGACVNNKHLHLAVNKDKLDVVKYLVSEGLEVTENLVEKAAFCGSLKVVQYLMTICVTHQDYITTCEAVRKQHTQFLSELYTCFL